MVFHRLGVVFIAMMFALGLFAGLGSTYVVASPVSATCHSLATDQPTIEHSSPAGTCDSGVAHMSCSLHVSCVAFAVPTPPTVLGHVNTSGWHPLPLSGLDGTSLSPEIPPPIASL